MKKYFVKTFGCAMNTSDSERIASFLEKQGFALADKIANADLVVFNTCGVKQTAENRAYSMIHVLRKNHKNKKVILTGCLANRKDVQKRLENKIDLFFPIDNFDLFKNFIIENYLKIKNLKLKIETQKNLPNKETINYLSIDPKHTNPYQALVPIMTGCNNFCSYCVVPYARGREISRSKKDIFLEIEKLDKKKYKEIVLLGQNVNSYCDKKNDFPKLLDFLAKKFPQIIFKFLTSHPKDFSQDLIEVIAKNKNISRNIHLPIQSGSNKILKAMNRPYTQKHYLDLIKKARKMISGVSFTTDVIVGFPGETEKDFQESVKVFQKVKFNEAYINKYSPRPGTAAYCLGDPISQEEKKRRENFLRKIL